MDLFSRKQKICMRDFIPERVICKNNPTKNFELNVMDDEIYINLNYVNKLKFGEREYNLLIPKYIKGNKETFEVFGLLQAEMGKKHDGKISFCNHEPRLINKVIKWFEDEFNFSKDLWKWYIKVNINEPSEENYKKEIENKVINYWIAKAGLSLQRSYPKKVSYIKNTENKELYFYDYGTLIIEKGSNLFSQIIKNLVKKTTENILNYEEYEIRNFMRGIIAGESTVEVHIKDKRYRIFITAFKKEERDVYHNCLKRLGIISKNYELNKDLIISREENNIKLLKQKLMTLSPEKYNKFLRMVNLYKNSNDLKEWRANLQRPHNKIPQEKINKIIELDKEHSDWPAWKIAEQVEVSNVKVQRVRKEYKTETKALNTI